MKTIILDGETFEFTSEQHKKLLKYAEKEILRKKLELALDARENDPKWKKKIQTIRSKDINKVSVVFDQLVSGYTGEDEENAIDTDIQKYSKIGEIVNDRPRTDKKN